MHRVCQVPLIHMTFHKQFAAVVAIDAMPQSLIAGNLITQFVADTPNVEVCVPGSHVKKVNSLKF